METFAQRLRTLRENVGLTRQNLALLLDMSQSGVECLEDGYTYPNIETLTRLAGIFNVSLKYLALLTDDASVGEDNLVKEVYVLEKLHNSGSKDILSTVYMNKRDMHGKDYAALVVKDNSMANARIHKDDEVIVSRQNYASNGEIIVALMADGSEIIRRYMRVGNVVTLTPQTDDKAFQTIKLDVTETPFSIIGKVHEVRIRIN